MTVFTIGYEGLSIGEFRSLLAEHHIHSVIDVRALPLSRKFGFSKNILSAYLDQAHCDYIHMRNLGCPQTIRYQYKKDSNWKRYAVAFNAYLATQSDAILQLSKFVKQANCALLCYEADASFCHRSLIANKLNAHNNINIVHIHKKIKVAKGLFQPELAVV